MEYKNPWGIRLINPDLLGVNTDHLVDEVIGIIMTQAIRYSPAVDLHDVDAKHQVGKLLALLETSGTKGLFRHTTDVRRTSMLKDICTSCGILIKLPKVAPVTRLLPTEVYWGAYQSAPTASDAVITAMTRMLRVSEALRCGGYDSRGIGVSPEIMNRFS